MTKREGLLFLESLDDYGIKLGLDKIRHLLHALGDPQKQYPSVLIAGTNGKGSVAKFLSEICTAAGYRTALYTSPHLLSVQERIQIHNRPISLSRLNQICQTLQKKIQRFPLELQPTYFEALTAAAFLFFAEERVDILICEVGMGGRFDATNVLASEISVIMPVSMDHTRFLGSTLEEIAHEKAGIIKKGKPLICGHQQKAAKEVIAENAAHQKAEMLQYPKDFYVRALCKCSLNGQILQVYCSRGKTFRNLPIRMIGFHQAHNCSVAIQTALLISEKILPISDAALRAGAMRAQWPGRFQVLPGSVPFILDGAHNEAGVKTLLATIDRCFPGQKLPMLVGILNDKDARVMIRLLAKKASRFFFVSPDTPRALSTEELIRLGQKEAPKIPADEVFSLEQGLVALGNSFDNQSAGIICGSLYLAGDVLRLLGRKGRKQ
ncbi:MAG: folylpolyglutamate synthase/dihydrofolate synthase family protein [Candidatus Ratteibacteria bacterium]|jgi:dihydrofolate synthase/folylpolyglutamate synthase